MRVRCFFLFVLADLDPPRKPATLSCRTGPTIMELPRLSCRFNSFCCTRVGSRICRLGPAEWSGFARSGSPADACSIRPTMTSAELRFLSWLLAFRTLGLVQLGRGCCSWRCFRDLDGNRRINAR